MAEQLFSTLEYRNPRGNAVDARTVDRRGSLFESLRAAKAQDQAEQLAADDTAMMQLLAQKAAERELQKQRVSRNRADPSLVGIDIARENIGIPTDVTSNITGTVARTIGTTKGGDITATEDDNTTTYNLPGGEVVFQGKRRGGGSFTGAFTDAEARKNLVTNLGLKDESELTYDRYGNISNVANRYKEELQDLQQRQRSNVVDAARSAQNLSDMLNITERAPGILEEDRQIRSQQATQQLEAQKALADVAIQKLAGDAANTKMIAEAEKFMAEARNMDEETRMAGTVGIIREAGKFFAEDGLQPEEMLLLNALTKMMASAQDGFFSLTDQRLYSREQLQRMAQHPTFGGNVEALKRTLEQVDADFDIEGYVDSLRAPPPER